MTEKYRHNERRILHCKCTKLIFYNYSLLHKNCHGSF